MNWQTEYTLRGRTCYVQTATRRGWGRKTTQAAVYYTDGGSPASESMTYASFISQAVLTGKQTRFCALQGYVTRTEAVVAM